MLRTYISEYETESAMSFSLDVFFGCKELKTHSVVFHLGAKGSLITTEAAQTI